MRVSTPACAKASAECVDAIPAPQYSVISRWTSTPAASTVYEDRLGGLERAVRRDVRHRGDVDGARNVAGGGIEPGREPAIVLRGSDVDEVSVDRSTGGVVDRRDPWVDVEQTHRAGLGHPVTDLQRQSGSHPRPDAAIEDADVDPPASQEPPRARRRDGVVVVIRDDEVAVVDPPAARGLLEALHRRQRVASALGVAADGQIGLQIDVDRPGQMACDVRGPALRSVQAPAHVQDAHRPLSGEFCGEFVRVDQVGHWTSVSPRVGALPQRTTYGATWAR